MSPSSSIQGLLVIVPCGQQKIWRQHPSIGPVTARDAYTGSPAKVNRRYAEAFAEKWVILSAKYGFIDPDFVISGPYDTTFKKKSSNPISLEELAIQVDEMKLGHFSTVVGLGGKDYRKAIEPAFDNSPATLLFPFAGLPVGKAMQAINRCIEEGQPFRDR